MMEAMIVGLITTVVVLVGLFISRYRALMKELEEKRRAEEIWKDKYRSLSNRMRKEPRDLIECKSDLINLVRLINEHGLKIDTIDVEWHSTQSMNAEFPSHIMSRMRINGEL